MANKKRTFIKNLFLLAGVVLCILILIPWYALSLFLNQRYEQPQFDYAHLNLQVEHLTLETQDGLSLASWRIFTENETPHGTVIIVSGIQYPSVTAFFGYGQMLAQNGWDTLLIEKRARSLSEGDSIGLSMTEWQDVAAGVAFLDHDERAGDLPIIALGTSAGASAVLIATGQVPRINGTIAISAFTSFTDVYIDNLAAVGLPRFIGHLTRPFMWLQLEFRFGIESVNLTPINALEHFSYQPLLLMHSTKDWQVPFSHFENLAQKADEEQIQLYTFTRTGNWHFVVYDRYLQTPEKDIAFTQTILDFLTNFE